MATGSFEDDLALYLNKIDFPSSKENLYQVWLNLDSRFWRRFFLKNFSIFTLSLVSPLGEGLSPSFEGTWNPLHPKMIYAKSG
jgi:hypothetical protein